MGTIKTTRIGAHHDGELLATGRRVLDQSEVLASFEYARDAVLFSKSPKLAELLREMIDLCAVGDVDETTQALGWGELIGEAKAALDEIEAAG